MSELMTWVKESVLLYGMMLAWKSYIGKKLAERLWIKFEDLDDYLVKYADVESITAYIDERTKHHRGDAQKAWNDFSNLENECLQELFQKGDRLVIGAGGRTIMHEENRTLIEWTRNLIWYYLEVDLKEQIRRGLELTSEEKIHRPALQDSENVPGFFTQMQEDRWEIYRSFSQGRIFNTWWKFNDVVNDIFADINKK